MKKLSIRLRVFLGTMTVVLAFVAVTTLVVDRMVASFLEAELTKELFRGRQAYTRYADLRDRLLRDQARSLAQVPHLRAVLGTPDVDAQSMAYTAASIKEASAAPLLLVTDAHGRLLLSTLGDQPPNTVVQHEGVQEVLRGGEFSGHWEIGGELFAVAASPATLGGDVLGLVAIGERLDQVAAGRLRQVTGHDVTLLYRGRVVATSWDEIDPPACVSLGASPPIAITPDEPVMRVSLDDEELLATSLAFADGSTTLVLSRPVESILVPFRSAKRQVVLLGACSVLLAFLVSQSLARRIARPIGQLRAAADELASGKLATEVEVSDGSELGQLAQHFNAMARRIETLMEETNERARAAQQANEAKSRFLATVSHELRTPLNGVLGFSELLLNSELGPEEREYALTVHSSGEDLLALIDDILDFSRIEAGTLRVEAAEFEVESLVRQAFDPLLPALCDKRLSLVVEIDERVPKRAVGAAPRLRQILLNYGGNAVKFTDQGEIRVRVSVDEETERSTLVRFAVSDTGIGIAPEDQKCLFQPFVQIETKSNRRYGGTGLGLAISREIAALLGGECGVASELGKGSTFWFTARLTRPEVAGDQAQPAASDAPPPAMPAPRRKKANGAPPRWRADRRILVAEDHAVNRRIVGLMLSKAGYPHAFAEDGEVALRMLDAEKFDLVLMDCQMPVIDGYEATRRLRERERARTSENGSAEGSEKGSSPRRLPVVALTANAMRGDREICMEAGMDDFLGKPFRQQDLVAVVDRYLAPAALQKRRTA